MTTYEYIEEIELMVKKKDGRLERFNPDKIITGLQKASEKRPITLEQIKNIAKGPTSAAYWANKVLWSGKGGSKKSPPKSQRVVKGARG